MFYPIVLHKLCHLNRRRLMAPDDVLLRKRFNYTYQHT